MSDTYTKTIASYLFLDLTWEILRQDIPNNRSRVKLTLKLRHTGTGIWFSAPKSGVLQGSSFTYTGGFSGSGTRTLQTREIWVNHNSNGSKSQTFSASFNPAFTYMGSGLGNQTVSGSATLPTIPRSSEVTAFSMGAALKTSTSNTVSVRLNVYSSAFRFDVSLRYGSNNIASWNNQSFTNNTSKSLALSTSEVNDLLSAMKNTSSGSVTIRVQTKSGSGGSNIGSVQSRNATASVHTDVKPTATGLSVEIDGTGRDSARSKYVQNISRVKTSFNASATGGATVSSRSIVVRQNTSKGNSMTINSASGTTGVVTQSGTYEAVASVRDSRGRTATQRTTFTVHAYSSPAITTFTADRNTATPTTVNISRAGRFTPLGSGDNTLTISIQRSADNGSTWTNVVPSTSTTSSTFSGTVNSTGNSVTNSYQFRIVISDSFGNRSEATAAVSTQRVVLDVHKNEGVGIGKIHEQGVLDVDGEIFTNGSLRVQGDTVFDGDVNLGTGNNGRLEIHRGGNPLVFKSTFSNGHAFMTWTDENRNRKGYLGVPSGTASGFVWENEMGGPIDLRGSELQYYGQSVVERGSGSLGDWVRFYDGTQICWSPRFSNRTTNDAQVPLYRSSTQQWSFPLPFSAQPAVIVTLRRSGGGFAWGAHNGGIDNTQVTNITILAVNATTTGEPRAVAIGRWK